MLLEMFVKIIIHFPQFFDEKKVQKNSIYLKLKFFTFDQFNASLLHKSMNFLPNVILLAQNFDTSYCVIHTVYCQIHIVRFYCLDGKQHRYTIILYINVHTKWVNRYIWRCIFMVKCVKEPGCINVLKILWSPHLMQVNTAICRFATHTVLSDMSPLNRD